MTDLDGNVFYDLTGSYGVNVFGNDFYKECMRAGWARVEDLGAVLGSYHPVVAANVQRLRALSGLDEVSFHMSGTEAVMQAVRLARYHTRRSHLVRFCGAYHGWWGDVQPGIGNPSPARETYTLKEMDEDTLHVLRTRRDIACVLVNPLQALHPNGNAPNDATLVDSARTARFDRAAYARWLAELRAVCSERGIVLIFDEVFVGFRLARGGAQEYFGVKADLVTYGKTLGGGLPVGALCGRKDLMKRFRDERPSDICFARGTFNSHPAVMGAMHEFLERLDGPEVSALYADLDRVGTNAPSGASTPASPTRSSPCASSTCRRSGRFVTRSRRVTTGCCNITCAPKGWRSAGWGRAASSSASITRTPTSPPSSKSSSPRPAPWSATASGGRTRRSRTSPSSAASSRDAPRQISLTRGEHRVASPREATCARAAMSVRGRAR